MVAWFLTAILTVGLFAYISLTGVSIVSNTQNTAQRSEAVRRLDMVIQGLQSQSAAPLADGVVYAPTGTFRNGLYGLPSSLLPVGVTAFGSKFVYCPMGGITGTTNDTVSFTGGSYQVGTTELNEKSYVVTGRVGTAAAADANVIAFVIAPVSGEGTMPGCNDVVKNGDVYTAPNAIVRVLRRGTITDVDAIRSDSGNTWYVTVEGRGNGQSPSTPASFAAATAAYRASLGGSFTMVLGSGTYSSGESLLDQSVTAIPAKKENSSLVITSSTAAAIRIAGSINVPSNVELRNIDLTGTPVIADVGRSLRSVNSSLGPVVARNRSSVTFAGTNAVRSTQASSASIYQQSGSTVTMDSSTLSLNYIGGGQAWRLEPSSSASLTQSTLNLNSADNVNGGSGSRLVMSDPNSQMNMRNAVVNVRGVSEYPFWIAGRLTAATTTFSISAQTLVGVQGVPGARIDLPDVTIGGTRLPTYALSSVGGSTITGYGNVSAATRCWYRGEGSLFRYSNVGYAGQNSLLSGTETPQPMNAQPTGVQVQRYQAAVARNGERTSLRTTLIAPGSTSGFVCQTAPAVSYQRCASENEECNLSAAVPVGQVTAVRYGAGSTWVTRMVGPEGISCTNTVFTDPLVGTVKECQYMVN
jgi:hypothetical protein